MGVNGDVLIRISRTAGRTVKLSNYCNGIVVEEATSNNNKRRKVQRPLRIGVDVSSWIARAAHGNGSMLVDDRYMTHYGRARLERGEETELDQLTTEENRRDYVQTCTQKVLKQVRVLEATTNGELLIVFDGLSPPIKKQEARRRGARKKKAKQERDGEDKKTTLDRRLRAARVAGAGDAYPLIIAELLQLLRENEITFLVSPYEADGQLAYLAASGMIDLVLTEDSDLLCHDIETIMFKYNDATGEGTMVRRCDLGAMELQSKTLSLLDFSTTMIAIMFVCIGCDYCDSLHGIGPVSARDIVRDVFQESAKSTVPIIRCVLDTLYDHTRATLTEEEKEQYESRFMAALFAYLHPIVFCPFKGKYILANNPGSDTDPDLLDYEPFETVCNDPVKQHELMGVFPERRFQIAIAEGWIDPRTHQPYLNQPVPTQVQALFAREDAAEEPLAQGGSCSDGDEAALYESQEREQDIADDDDDEVDGEHFETQGEQAAAEDPRETPPESQDAASQDAPESQFFGGSPVIAMRSSKDGGTPASAMSPMDSEPCQQPSQASLSHRESTRQTSDDEVHDDMSDDEETVFYPILSPHAARSPDNPMDSAQAGAASAKSPHPSTQSSCTTLGSGTKVARSSQGEDAAKSPNPSTQSSRTTLGTSSSSSKPATQNSSQGSNVHLSPALLP